MVASSGWGWFESRGQGQSVRRLRQWVSVQMADAVSEIEPCRIRKPSVGKQAPNIVNCAQKKGRINDKQVLSQNLQHLLHRQSWCQCSGLSVGLYPQLLMDREISGESILTATSRPAEVIPIARIGQFEMLVP